MKLFALAFRLFVSESDCAFVSGCAFVDGLFRPARPPDFLSGKKSDAAPAARQTCPFSLPRRETFFSAWVNFAA